jgi:2-dehydro-3-deoxygluconokinase
MNAAAVSPELVCLGEPMVEFNAGRESDGRWLQGFGGDTSNAAIAAARQEASVGYVTALGEDVFGDWLMALWNREHVDCRAVRRDPDSPTGVYFVTHDDKGHHFHFRRTGSAASRMSPDTLPLAYLRGAKILHVSGISQAISDSARDAVRAAMAAVREAGGRVSYDTNLRLRLWPLPKARETIHAAMAEVDVALPSYDDAVELTGLHGADAIVDFYLSLGPSIVALKMGSEGALVATPQRRERIKGFAVDALDATGAGDTFGGAFLARLLAGLDPFKAARYANAAAALSTRAYGAVAPIPKRAEVEALLRSNT